MILFSSLSILFIRNFLTGQVTPSETVMNCSTSRGYLKIDSEAALAGNRGIQVGYLFYRVGYLLGQEMVYH